MFLLCRRNLILQGQISATMLIACWVFSAAYYDQNCNSDSEEIKQAFEDLYEAMNGKTLREKDEVIYAICRLCRSHQQTGFIDGIKLGLYLSQELSN